MLGRVGRQAALGLAILGYHVPSVLILPTFLRRSPAAIPRVCRWHGDPTMPRIGLTFDDGPDAGTAATLDLLAKLGLKATFFALGGQVLEHPGLARRIVAEGHALGKSRFLSPPPPVVRAVEHQT